METVSFIVAARNVEELVGVAIQSALSQTGCNPTVIVTDDGSTDNTADVVRSIANRDPRVTLIEHSEAAGPSAARNSALRLARGDWIAILDADDLIAEGRTRKLLDLAAANSAHIVADNLWRFWDNGRQAAHPMFTSGATPYEFLIDVGEFIASNVMYRSGMGFGYLKPMIRTNFLRNHTISYNVDLRIGEDYQFALRCLLKGARYTVTSEPLYSYRVRAGSVSQKLRLSDLQAMLSAHTELEREIECCGGAAAVAASAQYVAALHRAILYNSLIEDIKVADIRRALVKTAKHPSLWPLVTRFGVEAVGKRIRF